MSRFHFVVMHLLKEEKRLYHPIVELRSGCQDLLSARRSRSEKGAYREIASQRMTTLLDLAIRSLSQDPERAQRYLLLARRLGMRYKVRIPLQFRHVICRRCKSLLVPGINARVRISQRREPHVVISCMLCKGFNRIPLRRRRGTGYKEDATEA